MRRFPLLLIVDSELVDKGCAVYLTKQDLQSAGMAHPRIFSVLLLCVLVSVGVQCVEIEDSVKDFKAPESFKKRFPYYLSGYDTDGAPVIVIEAGKWDYRGAIEAGEEQQLDKYITQMFLNWRKIGQDAPDSPGAVIIYDVDGFGARQASHPGVIALLVRQFPKFELINRKPGLKHIYAINVNFLAQRIYDVGRPLLGTLSNKIDVFGTNPNTWKPVLRREIDQDQMPEWYGGSPTHKVLKVYP